ncbi:MAG: M23 family metallopeptidase, partial [Anaerolineae bacterium]
TSPFGERVHPVFRVRLFHAGVDFAAVEGTPVKAANNGVVRFAGRAGGYGWTVVVDHGGGVVSLYGHNAALFVKQGEQVKRGQVICLSGNTGISTGPHLHFEMRVGGNPVDPIEFIASGGGKQKK